ncbi:lipocalin-like domain-containing protein [Solirubrobacter ginsenosidimutans]|uniref:Lipocalin-like domain-containing protein n=1 Tax=Solirubrobacter ginsenosidimutans TaxID=490573 RepID=A0A9X3MPR4_9ACTN|nr:lipocalin-like domain-containing protein [Solirubrobacter ginsenosidimutans]MDA0160137.1 lipocalin-like domain-containing protein [Solirubrobacter ginsenosidimutans]
MAIDLSGVWRLVAWRRIAGDGEVSYPLGDNATGTLMYSASGRMAVQLTAAGRPKLHTDDPLGGDESERAAAYSTCLAYVGSYVVQGDTVVHTIDQCLYPNWAGAEQSRPFTYDNGELVLRTPPMVTATGTVVNELAWAREAD